MTARLWRVALTTRNRDGFVIAGGAGVVVLEELERAKARGATIYGEIIGYGANSDGYDMVQPSGEGAVRCMQLALETAKQPIDYVNTHGTLYADRRPARDGSPARGVRQGNPALRLNQVAYRSLTGRHWRAGADLFPFDDA